MCGAPCELRRCQRVGRVTSGSGWGRGGREGVTSGCRADPRGGRITQRRGERRVTQSKDLTQSALRPEHRGHGEEKSRGHRGREVVSANVGPPRGARATFAHNRNDGTLTLSGMCSVRTPVGGTPSPYFL